MAELDDGRDFRKLHFVHVKGISRAGKDKSLIFIRA